MERGKIKKDKEGIYYESSRGIRYELLEGMTMDGDRRYTSDICFIFCSDLNYQVSDHFVGYIFGATFLYGHDYGMSYVKNEMEQSISELVDAYEKREFKEV